jgi:hypothetical protein
MAQLVLVTKQCYLICESINFISVDAMDRSDELKISKKGNKARKKIEDKRFYEITIDFVAAQTAQGNNHNRGKDIGTVTVNVQGKEECFALFNEMVKQIRDQMPDVLFLNKLVENFLVDHE